MRKGIFVFLFLLVVIILTAGVMDNDVTMTIKDGTLTKTGATLVIHASKNYMFDACYTIEKKENGQWKNLDDDVQNCILMGYQTHNGKLEMDANWEDYYGALENGEYKITKSYSTPSNGTDYVSLEFTIQD